MVQEPISLEPFLDAARDAAQRLHAQLPIVHTIMLDDWNTGNDVNGARLVYLPLCERLGSRDCAACSLYRLVGEDSESVDSNLRFRDSLCRAREDQLQLFQTDRPFLNCKKLSEYEEVFILWTLERCLTLDDFRAELRWVLGFRILVYEGQIDQTVLQKAERESKTRIINAIIARLQHDAERRQIACFYLNQLATW